jgi:hypothetical protein
MRLRDPALRSGTSNDDRFGFALDTMRDEHTSDGPIITSTWWERRLHYNNWYGTNPGFTVHPPNRRSVGDTGIINILTDRGYSGVSSHSGRFARLVVHCTKADYPVTVNGMGFIYDEAAGDGTYLSVTISSPGKYVTPWVDIGALNDAADDYYFAGSSSGSISFVIHGPADPSTSGPGLNRGHPDGWLDGKKDEVIRCEGPVCIPYADVQIKTHYVPESDLWIQDAYTPEEYRVREEHTQDSEEHANELQIQ